jgi:hypothetical protein
LSPLRYRDLGGDGERPVGSHLRALVPGQGPPEVPREGLDGRGERVARGDGSVSGGQVHEHQVAGRAFDQGADGGLAVPADDQIALPVAGDGPVGRFSGPLTDHDHVLDRPADALGRVAVRASDSPAGPKGSGQFPAEFTAALDIEGLVDRLVDHVHLRPIGEAGPQSLAYLLGTPPPFKVVLDEVPQLRVLADLARLGTGEPALGPAVSMEGLVGESAPGHGPAVAPYLPADGRGTAAQLGGDLPDRHLLAQPVGYVDAVALSQIPRGRRRFLGTRCRSLPRLRIDRRNCLLALARRVPAVAPPLAGTQVDPDDPGRFPGAVALLHELEVCGPLPGHPLPGRSPPVLPDLEVHCTPWAGVLQRPLELKTGRGLRASWRSSPCPPTRSCPASPPIWTASPPPSAAAAARPWLPSSTTCAGRGRFRAGLRETRGFADSPVSLGCGVGSGFDAGH